MYLGTIYTCLPYYYNLDLGRCKGLQTQYTKMSQKSTCTKNKSVDEHTCTCTCITLTGITIWADCTVACFCKRPWCMLKTVKKKLGDSPIHFLCRHESLQLDWPTYYHYFILSILKKRVYFCDNIFWPYMYMV